MQKIKNPAICPTCVDSKSTIMFKIVIISLISISFLVNTFFSTLIDSKVTSLAQSMDESVALTIALNDDVKKLEATVNIIKIEQERRAQNVYAIDGLKERINQLESKILR